jgi:hypothetical protein
MAYDTSIVNNRVCSNNELESNFYIFEIKIYTNNDLESLSAQTTNLSQSERLDIMTFRKISYKNEGTLLELENNIKKIKITMCRINNINNIITLRKNFTSIITKPIVLCRNNLVITLDNTNDNLSIRYIVI